MNSKKQLFVAIFLFFSSQFIFCQDISQASESVKKIAKIGVKSWQNTLILTTNQASKLLDLTTAYEMNKLEIYKSSSLSIEDKNSQLKDLEAKHNSAVEGILSEKQKEKFRAKLKIIRG